jgi:hypothetical protein
MDRLSEARKKLALALLTLLAAVASACAPLDGDTPANRDAGEERVVEGQEENEDEGEGGEEDGGEEGEQGEGDEGE